MPGFVAVAVGRLRSVCTHFGIAVAVGAGGLAWGCGGDPQPQSPPPAVGAPQDATGRTGTIGIPVALKTQPPLATGPYVTPSGKRIEPGARDALGYRLPLDVHYPPEPGHARAPERPDRDADSVPAREGDRLDTLSPEQIGTRTPLAPRVGSSFRERRVSPDDGHTQNETTIGVDGNTVIAGWNGYTDTGLFMGVARSTDGGDLWTTSLLAGHTVMSDPAIRAAGAGRWYYAYLAQGGFGGPDIDIFVRRSTDDGATWQDPVDASQNGSFDDKPYIDAAGDEVLVAWADFGFSPARVRASRSLDGGLSYGNISLLSSTAPGNGACPVIAPDGDYFVFWRGSAQESLWVARSTNDGISWTRNRGIVDMNPLPSSLPGGFRIVNLPTADADPLTGDLLVLWNDQRFGNPDILAIRSSDGGLSWSAPVRVNDDGGTRAQWFPWVHFDDGGIAHATWYDRRNDASLIDVYYARSLDGGATWEENARVTGAGFPPILPWDTSLQFIGDYNGIASNGVAAYPCYQDSREGNQDVYVSTVPLSTTGVPGVPGAGTAPPWAGRLTASPNPFTTSVRLEVMLPSRRSPPSTRGTPGDARIEAAETSLGATGLAGAGDHPELLIADVGGRILRRVRAPNGVFLWDGRDDTGRAVASGTYFVSVVGVRHAAQRLVRVE